MKDPYPWGYLKVLMRILHGPDNKWLRGYRRYLKRTGQWLSKHAIYGGRVK